MLSKTEEIETLHRAIDKGQTDIALTLIQTLTPEQLSLKNNDGDTPLHQAICMWRRKMLSP